MIPIPQTQAVILLALVAEKERLNARMAALDSAWSEVIAPLLPEGKTAADYVVVREGDALALHEREGQGGV